MDEFIKYIISRLIERATEAKEESMQDKNDEFQGGRNIAYYEMLDIVKSELQAHDMDLDEYGLDFNLEKAFL